MAASPTPSAAGVPPSLLTQIPDERLAELARCGDPSPFAELYRRHRAGLERYCLGILREPADAQDAVQTTMLRALAALDRRDPEAPVRAWLFRIAHNEAVDQLRRRRRHEQLDGAGDTTAPAPDRGVELSERVAALLGDLRDLPERQRAALVMRELGGHSTREIGETLSLSPGGVAQAVLEARAALGDFEAGREMACGTVRETIDLGDARRLRNRRVRAHLRACPGCREAREASRPSGWARALLPFPLWGELVARLSPAGPPGGLAPATAIVATVAATATAGLAGLPELRPWSHQEPRREQGALVETARPARAPAPPRRATAPTAAPRPAAREAGRRGGRPGAAQPAAPGPAARTRPARRSPAAPVRPAPAAASAPPATTEARPAETTRAPTTATATVTPAAAPAATPTAAAPGPDGNGPPGLEGGAPPGLQGGSPPGLQGGSPPGGGGGPPDHAPARGRPDSPGRGDRP